MAKGMTKTEIYKTLAERTGLNRKQVSDVFDELSSLIRANLADQDVGVFTIPGLLKIEKKHKPARPAKFNVPNPFKPGEMMDVPAKPATNQVKVRPLKTLKEMV